MNEILALTFAFALGMVIGILLTAAAVALAQAAAPASVQVPELARRANDLWVLIHTKSGACLPYRARPDRAFIDEYKPKGLGDE